MNFKKMDLSEKKKLYVKAKKAYYEKKKEIITDGEFDALEDLIRAEDADWIELHKTGVAVTDKKNEVELECPMPSLEKAYPEDLKRMVARNPGGSWIDMDKLDGTSLQLKCDGGIPVRLCTRGDGRKGRDVSFLIPTLVRYNRIPSKIAYKGPVILRLEGVMKKKVFERTWSREAAGKNGFDNARQGVNGAFLRKKPTRVLADIDLVVLGVYDMTIEKGLKCARKWGFTVVFFNTDFNPSDAEDMLSIRRQTSPYAIDGRVLAHSSRVMTYENEDKPKGIFAFKVNDNASADVVTVEDVVYTKTRLGRWQPKIKIKPTTIDGVVVTQATAHNPAWMKEQGIGPGAVIKILRSGGVIPKIVEVIEPAEFKEPPGFYGVRGRFFYVIEEDASTRVRGLHFFMTTLGIELLAQKTLEKLYDAGFETPDDYIRAVRPGHYMEETVEAPGFRSKTAGDRNVIEALRRFQAAGVGEVMSQKILIELQRVLHARIPLKKLMVASGRFSAGMGERKLSQLEAAGFSMRDICNMKSNILFDHLMNIKGFQHKTAKLTVDGIAAFREWYRPLKDLIKVDGDLPVKSLPVKGLLTGMTFAFTGYRNMVQEQILKYHGGEVVTFTGKTNFLLYDPNGKASTKIEKAGARAITWPELVAKFGIPKLETK